MKLLITPEFEKECIALYLSGLSMQATANKKDCSLATIHNICKRNKVKIRPKNKVPPEKEQELIQDYQNGMKKSEMRKKYKISDTVIRDYILKNGLEMNRDDRDYPVNDNLLDDLSKEEACWLIGWIWTDGNMSRFSNTIKISFNKKDEELIEKFKKVLGNGSTYFHKSGKMIDFIFNSKRIYKKLLEIGCCPAKSNIIEFPKNIPNNFNYRGWFRGVLEGDGTVSSKYNNGAYVDISSGSKNFVEQLQKFLFQTYNITTVIKFCPKSKTRKGDCYRLIFNGDVCNRLKFYNLIYKNLSNENLCLKRKYDKYRAMHLTHDYKMYGPVKNRIVKGPNQNYFPD